MTGGRTGSRLCPARFKCLLLFLATLSAEACTSVSWTDSEGVTHHGGLVMARIVELPGEAKRVERWGLGLDCRMAGLDPGWTIGISCVEETTPAIRTHPMEGFSEAVLQCWLDPKAAAPAVTVKPVVHWRFLYFTEPAHAEIGLLDGWHLGFAWRTGAADSLSLGWCATQEMTGQARWGDGALIRADDPDERDRDRLILWRLEPDQIREGDDDDDSRR